MQVVDPGKVLCRWCGALAERRGLSQHQRAQLCQAHRRLVEARAAGLEPLCWARRQPYKNDRKRSFGKHVKMGVSAPSWLPVDMRRGTLVIAVPKTSVGHGGELIDLEGQLASFREPREALMVEAWVEAIGTARSVLVSFQDVENLLLVAQARLDVREVLVPLARIGGHLEELMEVARDLAPAQSWWKRGGRRAEG